MIGLQGWPDIGRRCFPSKDGRPGYEYEPGSDEAEARYELPRRSCQKMRREEKEL